MKETNRILADANKQGQKFIICDMFDKGPKGAARAKYVVEAVNQHQSLVAERESLILTIKNALDKVFNDGRQPDGWVQIQQSAIDELRTVVQSIEQRSTSE